VRKAIVLVVLAAAAAAGWWFLRSTTAWHVRPGRPTRNLLLVSLDTLRSDRLGCYGHAEAQTPRLDALALRGARFDQATTVTPLTLPAHSSLLTGTFPAHHGVRDNGGFYLGNDETTLAEVLQQAGYRTGGFVGAFVLDSRWGIAQGFDRYFDDFDLTRFEQAPGMDAIQRPGREVVDEALRWLEADREKPFFAWVHLYDPHAPYEAPEPFRSQFPATASGAYHAEIAATDAQVGRLLDFLQLSGHDADTVVIVVADHGEMLGEHGEPTHGFFIYDGAVHIPLIVAGPGVPARRVAEQVRIVDVMPTALELVGVKVPASVQGASLMPLLRGQPLALVAHSESWYPRYHYGWSELSSVQDGRYKFIRAPRRELYDLQRDPGETSDLSTGDAARAAALDTALGRLLAQVSRTGAPRGPATVDAETEERLQALGYIGGSLSPRRLAESPRGDPKDKIGLYNRLKLVSSLSIEGRLEEALAEGRKALAEDPEVVEAHLLLGNVLKKARRTEEALASYRAALERDPDHQEALYSLALAYKDLARLDDSLAGFERLEQLDPKNGKVLWQLGDIWMRKGSFAEAEAVLKRALGQDLDRTRFLLKLGECYLEMKRPDEAETTLRQALAARPDLPGAHFDLGLLYEDRGQPSRAIGEYEAELSRNPKGYRALFNLAKLLQGAGRGPEAVARFREVVALQPGFGTGHLYLAKALLDAGDLRGAEEAARRGLLAQPEPRIAPLGHLVLADVYNGRGDLARARREEAKARQLQSAAGPAGTPAKARPRRSSGR
jgi:arylsulfatase A-like enzyme/Tfp pilus assembly protein PilF